MTRPRRRRDRYEFGVVLALLAADLCTLLAVWVAATLGAP